MRHLWDLPLVFRIHLLGGGSVRLRRAEGGGRVCLKYLSRDAKVSRVKRHLEVRICGEGLSQAREVACNLHLLGGRFL